MKSLGLSQMDVYVKQMKKENEGSYWLTQVSRENGC